MNNITKNEVLVGFILFGLLIAITVLGVDMFSRSAEENYLKYQLALKIDKSEYIQHAYNTQVGDTLVYYEIVATENKSIPDIRGEYSIIEKTREEYTMHTRTVSYSCGDDDTCYRTETYWTWDYAGSEVTKTPAFKIADIVFSNLCFPGTEWIRDLKEVYQGNNDVRGGYAYETSDVRYYYNVKRPTLVGTLFVRFFDGQIDNPIDKGRCIPINENKQIDEVVKSSEPNYLFLWVGAVFLIIVLMVLYIYMIIDKLEF